LRLNEVTNQHRIEQLLTSEKKANISLAFSLLVGVEGFSVIQAIRKIFSRYFANEPEGTRLNPFYDYNFLGVNILYYYQAYKQTQLIHYECSVDGHLKYTGIVTDVYGEEAEAWIGHCYDHFNQNIHQYVYLIEQQFKKS